MPNDEVKAAIERVKVRTSLGRCNIAEMLTALAAEDAVMRMMNEVRWAICLNPQDSQRAMRAPFWRWRGSAVG